MYVKGKKEKRERKWRVRWRLGWQKASHTVVNVSEPGPGNMQMAHRSQISFKLI